MADDNLKLYEEIYNHIKNGTITDVTKKQLEIYASALCKTGANNSFGSSFHAVCGTIRTLIIVRMSEESNKEATKISKIALIVAVFALICGVVQVILGALSYSKDSIIKAQCPIAKESIRLQPSSQPAPAKK